MRQSKVSRALSGLTALVASAITACAPSTHVLVGHARPPITPDQVKIYSHPPATPFEEIAVLDASSKSAFGTGGQKSVDKVVERLKIEDRVDLSQFKSAKSTEAPVTGTLHGRLHVHGLGTGRGGIQLGSETIDLSMQGDPKNFRFVRLRAPVSITGTLGDPTFGIKPEKLAAQAGAAVALGVLLTPVASILAFIDPGLAKDEDCVAVLAQEQDATTAPAKR